MIQGKMIAIVGETASGKSDIAMDIAREFNGELICADSRTVYRGMDIATAKPTLNERKEIVHHGLDLVEPNQRFSAAQFKDYAVTVINDIYRRGKLPILVGGTGLYVNGVLYDYSFGGEHKPNERSKLNNKSVDELTTIASELEIEIPHGAAKNKRHLIRLIERDGFTENSDELAYNVKIIGVKMSRTQLRARVEKRVEKMFRKGLRKEYNDLKEKYGTESEAFTGIGYKEFRDFDNGNASMSEVKRNIVKNTMNYAKRQRTWFKRDSNIEWVASHDEALELARGFLDNTTNA